MNEDTQPYPEDGAPGPSPQRESKRRFDSLSDAVRAGKEDGAAKAREKAPEMKSGFAHAVHDLAYGVAYGSMFAGAIVNELMPQSVREGFRQGANAGRRAGEGFAGGSAEAPGGPEENPTFS